MKAKLVKESLESTEIQLDSNDNYKNILLGNDCWDINDKGDIIEWKMDPTHEGDDAHHFQFELSREDGKLSSFAIKRNGDFITDFVYQHSVLDGAALNKALDDWNNNTDDWEF